MSEQPTTLPSLRERAAVQNVRPGFTDASSFELMQRGAKLLSHSTLVPVAYRAVHTKTDRFGNITESTENPAAMSNCVVALNMATRVGADPLMVMQNLYIVEGRPSWSSQYIIAAINSCGRYSPLRFDLSEPGPEEEFTYTTHKWVDNKKQVVVEKVRLKNRTCIAWAIEKETGQRLESPVVSMAMSIAEGWYSKNGSKWQTMPDVMLRYRAASFFGKLYAPELLMGLQSAEEMHEVIEMEKDDTGAFTQETVKDRIAVVEAAVEAVPEEVIEAHDVVETKSEEPDPHADWKASIDEIATIEDFIAHLNKMPAKVKKELHAYLEAKQARIRASHDTHSAPAQNASSID